MTEQTNMYDAFARVTDVNLAVVRRDAELIRAEFIKSSVRSMVARLGDLWATLYVERRGVQR